MEPCSLSAVPGCLRLRCTPSPYVLWSHFPAPLPQLVSRVWEDPVEIASSVVFPAPVLCVFVEWPVLLQKCVAPAPGGTPVAGASRPRPSCQSVVTPNKGPNEDPGELASAVVYKTSCVPPSPVSAWEPGQRSGVQALQRRLDGVAGRAEGGKSCPGADALRSGRGVRGTKSSGRGS